MSRNGLAIILLSSYRGSEHLPAMLDSLARQDWPNCKVMVRDDGSDDETRDVLERLSQLHAFEVDCGSNIGSKASFARMLAQAPEAEATFFADQDDIWYPDKVRRAMVALARVPSNRPVLYCSALDIVTDDLKPLAKSPAWPKPPSFANALVENIATGCTIALNSEAANLLRRHPPPQAAIMHDWWAYLVISALGQVIYDPVPSLAYRRHARNQVGLPSGQLDWLSTRLRRRLKGDLVPPIIAQARAVKTALNDDLTPEVRAMVDRLCAIDTLSGRLAFLNEREIHRQFARDQAAMKLMVMFNTHRFS